MFKKILIANRGEIAVRILRACRELGIRSVAVYSDVDRAALHVRLADEAYPIGAAPSRDSYLVIEKIIGAARYSGCDAIHPGYGFLAENPALARACAEASIKFIGPSPEAMERLGSKTAARHDRAKKSGFPRFPARSSRLKARQELAEVARKTGFPVVLKAVAGGGGKGMRVVTKESDLDSGAGAMLLPKLKTPLATAGCTSKNIWSSRGTSRFRSWAISTGTWFIWASASVRSSGDTRK